MEPAQRHDKELFAKVCGLPWENKLLAVRGQAKHLIMATPIPTLAESPLAEAPATLESDLAPETSGGEVGPQTAVPMNVAAPEAEVLGQADQEPQIIPPVEQPQTERGTKRNPEPMADDDCQESGRQND